MLLMTLEEWLSAQSPILYAEAVGSKCVLIYRQALQETLPHVNDNRIKELIRAHLLATENEECLCKDCYLRVI